MEKREGNEFRDKLSETAIRREHEAFNALDNGDYNRARQIYSSLVQIYSDDSYLCFNLALAFVNLNEVDSAAFYWGKCIELGEGDALTYSNLGFALLELGKASEAVPEFNNARLLDPGRLQPIVGLGYAYIRLDSINKAADYFRQAISLDKDQTAIYVGLGEALLKSGAYDAAIDTLLIPIRENATIDIRKEAYFFLGNGYKGKGDFFSANRNFNECLKLDSTHYGSLVNKGFSLAQMDSCNAAIKILERAKAIYPDSVGIYTNLAMAYLCNGNDEKAVNEYNLILERDKCPADAYNGLGMIAGNSGKDSLAMVYFGKALDCNPYHENANFNLGLACRKSGNWICAKIHFDMAWQQAPHDTIIRHYYLEASAKLMTEPQKIRIQ